MELSNWTTLIFEKLESWTTILIKMLPNLAIAVVILVVALLHCKISP